ncbi:FAD dependent oxidoreductase, partial [Scleroderma yunnanense]
MQEVNAETTTAPEYRCAGLPRANPTQSFWIHSSPNANPLRCEGNDGPLTADADICIIGSGITGVGVAYHLSELVATLATTILDSPLRAVILEAREFCGGATGRNGGHLTPISFFNFAGQEEQYGIEEAIRSSALETYTASSIVNVIERHGWSKEIDLVNGGHVSLFFTQDEIKRLERDFERAKSAGLDLDDVQWLTAEETFGTPYPAVTRPGWNLWPAKLVTKLYERAIQRVGERFDLKLHTYTPVTSVERLAQTVSGSERALLLSTHRGSISCSRVVHATNGYASYLLPNLADPDGIMPWRGQIIATRASVGPELIGSNSWSKIDEIEGLDYYWFPRPLEPGQNNPLVILGRGSEPCTDDDSSLNPAGAKRLRELLPGWFEGKYEQGNEPEMEWSGITAYTAMRDPFVGPVIDLSTGDDSAYRGQYISAGYSGHGMPRAFGCAEVVAQMIIAELSGNEWSCPMWLPERYLTWNRVRHQN